MPRASFVLSFIHFYGPNFSCWIFLKTPFFKFFLCIFFSVLFLFFRETSSRFFVKLTVTGTREEWVTENEFYHAVTKRYGIFSCQGAENKGEREINRAHAFLLKLWRQPFLASIHNFLEVLGRDFKQLQRQRFQI